MHASQSYGQPYTGKQYLASLRDGRAVYINGERVKDVTEHVAFRNSARSIAMLYDALHDPAKRQVLTVETDTGNGGFTHRYFRPARSAAEMKLQREAIAEWSRMTYGWMGRTPDYKASLMNTLGANAEYYGKFSGNARTWHRKVQENVLFMNHALANPPVDRAGPTSQIKDVCVKIEKETDAGIYVSGAKVVATSAAFTHFNFIGQNAATATDDTDLAVMFILPMDVEGLKLICRTSYERQAAMTGSPFDYPLSSRFDENDAIFVLENVFVPWENVLVHRDVERIKNFYPKSGFVQGLCFQGCTRFAVKLDFMAGLLSRALHTTGGDGFRGNQAMLGEVVSWRNLMWSLSDAMCANPEPWVSDCVLPNGQAGAAYRVFAPEAWAKVKEIVDKVVASALIYLPSSVDDFQNPEIDGPLSRYVRGSNGIGHRERIKVMKLIWDAVGTEFGGRHALYERNYAGNHEEIRLQALGHAERSGAMDHMKRLVSGCLADYDESGWASERWISTD